LADFELFDNRVRQVITEVTPTADLGIDLTFLIDVSGSVTIVQKRFRDQVLAVASKMKPIDTIRVIAFGTNVVEVVPRQPASNPLVLDGMRVAGATSLNDAILLGLLERCAPGRTCVGIVYTDGQDTSSNRPLADVRMIVRQSDSMFFIALAPRLRTGRAGLPRDLAELARETGGTVFEAGDFDALDKILAELFDDLRSRYVLYYAPRDVARAGWHDIRVRVKGRRDYVVLARRGFFVEMKN
jgi:VWFA-related protein